MVLFAVKLGTFFLPSFCNFLGESPFCFRHQSRLGVLLRRIGVGGHCCIFSF